MTSKAATLLFVLFILLSGALPAAAEDTLRFNQYTITAQGVFSPAGAGLLSKSAPGAATRYYLVHLSETPSSQSKKALRSGGVELMRYVGNGGWLARLGSGVDAGKLPGPVQFAQPLLTAMKIDSAFAKPSGGAEVGIVVHAVAGANPGALTAAALPAGARAAGIASRGNVTRAGFRVDASRAGEVCAALSNVEGVYYIERDRGVKLLSDEAVRILQSGSSAGSATLFNHGLHGQGQIIAICDTGIDADSCYVRHTDGSLPPVNAGTAGIVVEATRRKVIAVNFLDPAENPANVNHWDTQDHGTTVAGCAGGSLITDPLANANFNGMAPAAQFVIQDAGFAVDNCSDLSGLGCPVIDLTPVFNQTYLQGARFHNNSWGDRENFVPHNTYTARSEDVDDFMWLNKDFLIICAAGNDGAAASVHSPGAAKNAISVGGTGNGLQAEEILSFSSRGPASDGRIKPDVCAPGSATMADNDLDITTNNCTTRSSLGTSFSSPFTAGACALIRNYLQEGFYPTGSANPPDILANPSSALIKALLINGAADVAQAQDIPAVDQGWGRVHLDNALYFDGDARKLFLDDHRSGFTGASSVPVQYAVEVAGSTETLKATLVWTDYPGTPGADPQLVNNLDLSVISGSTTWRGNFFSGGFSESGGVPDNLNNVEQVLINAPPPGVYTVVVAPAAIPIGPQDFALVITGAVEVTAVSSTPVWRAY